MNPQIVLETITNPTPLTLGKMAILEKIKSPLLTGETPTAYDLIPSVYIYTHPHSEINLTTITQDALTWADTLTIPQYQHHEQNLIKSIQNFFTILPNATGTPKETKKNSPKTATS